MNIEGSETKWVEKMGNKFRVTVRENEQLDKLNQVTWRNKRPAETTRRTLGQ